MVKRTHLDLSVKCGSTPTRPGLEKWRKEWMNLSLSVLRHLIKGKARCNNTNRYTQWYDDLCAERDVVLGVFKSRQNVKCNFEISKMFFY